MSNNDSIKRSETSGVRGGEGTVQDPEFRDVHHNARNWSPRKIRFRSVFIERCRGNSIDC
jgi:hypothetical protein